MNGSGGKIIHNIIEGNHVEKEEGYDWQLAGGIFAYLHNNHTLVIRNNVIRNNKVISPHDGFGGGLFVMNGRFICENNVIRDNSIHSQNFAIGGGLVWDYTEAEGIIQEAVIRNNLIIGNSAMSTNVSLTYGGGYAHSNGFENRNTLVYNNIIYNNHAGHGGGGMALVQAKGNIFNNTIVDNTAVNLANNMAFYVVEDAVVYNNIIWSTESNTISDNELYETEATNLHVFNNIMTDLVDPDGVLTVLDKNSFQAPIFSNDPFELAENSPGIGWALDSAHVGDTWVYAPKTDFYGRVRPHTVDTHIDLGAIESTYEGIVYIPDTAFLYTLIFRNVDANEDRLISYTEAEAVSSLVASNRGIKDMTGIEAFINLDSLDCHGNLLTSLYVSNNTALEFLDCTGNELTNLDISENSSLIHLKCHDNQLTSLNVTGCTALKSLDCSFNELTNLDVSNNIALEGLSCHGNELTNLDVSNNSALGGLACSYNQLTSLDVTNNTAIKRLICSYNQLTSLDVTNNPNLTLLFCGKAGHPLFALSCRCQDTASYANQLTSLDVSNNTALEYFDCSANPIASLDISSNDLLHFICLCSMDSLHQVCVSVMPFPTESVYLDTTDSPNVYFTTECSDLDAIENKLPKQIRIYPNPSMDLLTIETDISDHYSLEITSMNGQRMYTDEPEGTSHPMDLSSFQKGVYFITIRSEDFVATSKIIKF